ncbi:MAG: DNA repair exonuclease [Oscillospiraceae bacterium]|jgi:DNA repair exonuclease SbcCD nuclease subunit|nr:DNA repair exonuclease [Oscillospiraceae bacterium]
MKILHAADLHLDSPFDGLSAAESAIRRSEQRDLLARIAELAQSERVDVVLLAGDLFDSVASFYQTHETLLRAFESMDAQIFIAPGNHDYYCPKSPYAHVKFPENVHIFKSETIERVDLPHLNASIYGAGFTAPSSPPLLRGFIADDADSLNIMVLHGDTSGDVYNHVSEADVASSGLDYLALGHVHTFSGILKAGKTRYAYSGCAEGRGFDETGKMGVIIGEITKSVCDLRFVPLGGREYVITSLDLTGATDALAAISAATMSVSTRDTVRIILSGAYDGRVNTRELEKQLSERFFRVQVRDNTRPVRDVWDGANEDTLRGAFLREMRTRYDAADGGGKTHVLLAVRFGLSALDSGEEYAV